MARRVLIIDFEELKLSQNRDREQVYLSYFLRESIDFF